MAKTELVCENIFQTGSDEERQQALTEMVVELIQYLERSKIAS